MTKKKENKNAITVEQSHKLGFELTNVRTGLQALRNHANTLMLAKRAGADNGLLRLETDKFLETVFDMVEIYSKWWLFPLKINLIVTHHKIARS